LASLIFRGENADEELLEAYRADLWLWWIQQFLVMVHRKYGHLVHLPTSGGALEQPYRAMAILTTIQRVYFDFLKEQNEKG